MVELNKDPGAVTVTLLRHALYTAYMFTGGDTELIGITGAADFIYPGKFRENQAAIASGSIFVKSDPFWRRLRQVVSYIFAPSKQILPGKALKHRCIRS